MQSVWGLGSEMERKCYKCKEIKEIELFKPDKRRKSGKAYICKKCFQIVKSISRRKNKSYSKYTYGPKRKAKLNNKKHDMKSGGCVLCG